MIRREIRLYLLALVALGAASPISAAVIQPGVYALSNHPDGTALPPPYGMRLDELYDVTSGHDIFTFDFNAPGSSMTLTYDDSAQTIAISGVSWGGRDIGGAYAADSYLGLYTIEFLYDVGVGQVPGDDDIWVAASMNSNFGSITTPLGDVRDLSDKHNGPFTFRFGDEDNDLGHRGFAGISGWGWLMVDGAHTNDMDWLFTAHPVPEPSTGAIVLAGLGCLLIQQLRRKS